jgi:hypothetical protein
MFFVPIFVPASAGNSVTARRAIVPITTSNSVRVKPSSCFRGSSRLRLEQGKSAGQFINIFILPMARKYKANSVKNHSGGFPFGFASLATTCPKQANPALAGEALEKKLKG